jgi:RNA-binding protein NOB1
VSESPITSSKAKEESAPLYDDPSDEDDGEGEWITPTNVNKHKEKARQYQTVEDKQNNGPMAIACMTADFAMQNVLLHMGLNLVGVEGKRISQVKTWVLRCHACFK